VEVGKVDGGSLRSCWESWRFMGRLEFGAISRLPVTLKRF
jgi:hypothetical protein